MYTYNHAAEECESDGFIRLVGFDSARAGVVEVCEDGVWARVRVTEESPWTTKSSIVACRQLGFPNAVGITTTDR